MGILHCLTPQMNEKEVWVFFLAYNLIRLLMCEAAVQAGVFPRQISFKHTLQVWVAWSRYSCNVTEGDHINLLFVLIAERRVGNRPRRVEPRAVKRRPKPYPRLIIPRTQARDEIRKYGHPKKA